MVLYQRAAAKVPSIDAITKMVATNVDKFADIAYKYTDLQRLTLEVLRTFLKRW